MGVVIPFPKSHTRLRSKPYWRVVDLRGKKPSGHVAPMYGPRGRVLMARGQVWVERHNQRLWVIGFIAKNPKRKDSLYPNDVTLIAYRGSEERTLAETSVRLQMDVWEVHLTEHKALMEKLDRLSRDDPGSPWHGRSDATQRARNFFSFDAQGNRID
ncbi:MAG: hypothetical protein KA066_01265 [Candidatus Pacebacteria bacterium]|nr:hypothetical protein [Candidatus Paceibacterota bacterium]